MKLPIPDLIVFIVLTFGNVILGVSFFIRNKTSDQFTSRGGRLPSWVVGMSIFATLVRSMSILAHAGKDYLSNCNIVVFSLSLPFALLLAIKFFIPLLSGFGRISLYNYFEIRFIAWTRIYASFCCNFNGALSVQANL